MKFILKLLFHLNLLNNINYKATLSINGRKLKIPIIKGLGITHLNLKHNWFTGLIELLNVHYPNHQFIDIGANIGQTLIQVQSVAPQWHYIGFEPNDNCVIYLNEFIKCNNISKSKIYPYAVSNKAEKINLYLNSDTDTTATTLDTFRPNVYDKEMSKEIIAIKFDDFFNNELSKDASFIVKIDIEGAEYLALQGMTNFLQNKRPILICEVLDTHSEATMINHKIHLKGIEDLLKSINYNIYQILRTPIDNSITELKQIEHFETKIWTEKSLLQNDFLFIPQENPIHLNAFLN